VYKALGVEAISWGGSGGEVKMKQGERRSGNKGGGNNHSGKGVKVILGKLGKNEGHLKGPETPGRKTRGAGHDH